MVVKKRRKRRKKSSRIKRGWYAGMKLDSSWELSYVLYCQDHHIEVTRNTQKFPYIYRGRKSNYIPDFQLADGSYVEIKGRETSRTAAKFKYFDKPLIIIRRKEIMPILKYAQEKYGIDFWKMLKKTP